MKRLRFLFVVLITVSMIISINSCKKDDKNTNTTPNNPTYNFSAKVDGELFNANVSYMYLTNPSNSYSITINTSDVNDIWKNWSLQFFSDTIGTFQFTTNFPTPGVAKASYSTGPTGTVVHFDAINGSVIVTKIDTVNKKISGTFNFTCADENNSANTKVVTEGTFTDVPKQ